MTTESYNNIPDLIKEVHLYTRDLRGALQDGDVLSPLKTVQYSTTKEKCLNALRKILALSKSSTTSTIVYVIGDKLTEALSSVQSPHQLGRDQLDVIANILDQLESVIAPSKQSHFAKLKQLLGFSNAIFEPNNLNVFLSLDMYASKDIFEIKAIVQEIDLLQKYFAQAENKPHAWVYVFLDDLKKMFNKRIVTYDSIQAIPKAHTSRPYVLRNKTKKNKKEKKEKICEPENNKEICGCYEVKAVDETNDVVDVKEINEIKEVNIEDINEVKVVKKNKRIREDENFIPITVPPVKIETPATTAVELYQNAEMWFAVGNYIKAYQIYKAIPTTYLLYDDVEIIKQRIQFLDNLFNSIKRPVVKSPLVNHTPPSASGKIDYKTGKLESDNLFD